jgi:multidrug efflux pump subunit AcrB
MPFRSGAFAKDKSIYHKNLMPVTYVTADIAGEIESPVYAMLKLGPKIVKIEIPEGYVIEQHMAALPSDPNRYSMKWDGEWHITYEMFRDLGIAFAFVVCTLTLGEDEFSYRSQDKTRTCRLGRVHLDES